MRSVLLLATLLLACVPLGGGCPASRAAEAVPTSQVWTCPMHPAVRAPAPSSCPICQMALTPLHDDAPSGAVVVDAVRRQRFGVRTASAEVRALVHDIRAAGNVRWEKSRLLDVAVRGDTWVERLHVTGTGTLVRRGQPMAEVYSPMLYAAQREFLASRGSEREISKHERLKLLGLSPSQITELAASGTVTETTQLVAPETGVVVELDAIQGTHLMEGARFARIARMDQVWIEAEVFESDVGQVKLGASIRVHPPGGAAPLPGVVDRVEPWLDEATRRARIRATVPNPDGILLPNMYVDVEVHADLGEHLAVPAEAVIATGDRRIVFVDQGSDRLVPRDVEVGRRAGDWLEVRSGLSAGDVVVTSGAFLVASESRLRASETFWRSSPADAHPAH